MSRKSTGKGQISWKNTGRMAEEDKPGMMDAVEYKVNAFAYVASFLAFMIPAFGIQILFPEYFAPIHDSLGMSSSGGATTVGIILSIILAILYKLGKKHFKS